MSLLFPPTLRRQKYIPRAGGMTARVVIMHNKSASSSVGHNVSHWMVLKKKHQYATSGGGNIHIHFLSQDV